MDASCYAVHSSADMPSPAQGKDPRKREGVRTTVHCVPGKTYSTSGEENFSFTQPGP